MLLVMHPIPFFSVIIARHLYDVRTLLGTLPRHIVRSDGHGCIFLRIILSDIALQPSCNLLPMLIRMRVINFISDGPKEHAGMIAIPANPAGDILSRPINKESCIVIGRLRALPHVKALRVYQESHAIRQLHKLWCRRIVTRANAVHAHPAQNCKLTLECLLVKGRAKASQIMMLADAMYLHDAPI